MLCNAVTLKFGQTHSSLHYNIISFDDDYLLLENKITIIECLLGSKKINLLTWPIIYHTSNVLNFSFLSCLNLRFIVSSLFSLSFDSLLVLFWTYSSFVSMPYRVGINCSNYDCLKNCQTLEFKQLNIVDHLFQLQLL